MSQHPLCLALDQGPPQLDHRNSIERFFNEIKLCRRVATRYAKLAAIYLAIKPVSIRIWLHANESAPKSRCATQRKPRR